MILTHKAYFNEDATGCHPSFLLIGMGLGFSPAGVVSNSQLYYEMALKVCAGQVI